MTVKLIRTSFIVTQVPTGASINVENCYAMVQFDPGPFSSRINYTFPFVEKFSKNFKQMENTQTLNFWTIHVFKWSVLIPLRIFSAAPFRQQSTQGGGTSRYRLLERLGPYCHHCCPWLYWDQNQWSSPPHCLCQPGECYLCNKHINELVAATASVLVVHWPLCICTKWAFCIYACLQQCVLSWRNIITYLVLNRSGLLAVLSRSDTSGHLQSANKTKTSEKKLDRQTDRKTNRKTVSQAGREIDTER